MTEASRNEGSSVYIQLRISHSNICDYILHMYTYLVKTNHYYCEGVVDHISS